MYTGLSKKEIEELKNLWLIKQNVRFFHKYLQNKMSYYKVAIDRYKPIYKTKCPIVIYT